ncbi:MAG: NAD(P)H-hydrate dehydratase [Clostridiales bacterium]|nr:NAD(P)H-hydrate dehydratase [Clostridiales bacterium]
MRLLTGEEMRAADEAASKHFGIPGIVLMENAALGVVEQTRLLLGELKGARAVVFCGGGNNGGDGFAIARHLFNRGAEVRVFLLAEEEGLKDDALTNYRIICNLGLTPQVIRDAQQINLLRLAIYSADVVIDAIIGAGLSGSLNALALSVIKAINAGRKKVVAVDIPSGLCARTGRPLPAAVEAALTVTFGFCKLGLAMPAAAPYTGKLVVADISLPQGVLEYVSSKFELTDDEICRLWLPARAKESHKGNFGHALLLAGSRNMPGAATLAARAALRGGLGLLTAGLPEGLCPAFAASANETMLLPLPQTEEGGLSLRALEKIKAFAADALIIGPGLSRGEETVRLVRELLPRLKCPAVVDADALFALTDCREAISALKTPLIFTPHEGELAHLAGLTVAQIRKDRVAAALSFAKEWNVVLVLKGAATVIASPEGRVFINGSGNPGMATAGSGDVLSGLTGAFLAQRLPEQAAAAVAVYLHGKAGDLAAAQKTERGLIARDIIENIPAALKTLADCH